MSSKPDSVVIVIMGKEYRVACDAEEQDDLVYSAQQLDVQMRRMRDSGKINGADRIAVMSALNLAHELQLVKNQNEALKERLHECLASINHKIENVLENP
jgi:cell division protein ZapA